MNRGEKGVSSLSDTEVQSLKEDMQEIKTDVKEIHNSLSDLKVLIAGNYVTRTDLEEHRKDFERHKKDEIMARRWLAGIVISASGVIMAILNYFKI